MDLVKTIIDYIEDHLFEDLSIDRVATRAGYAKHHFQRLFIAATGTTLGTYITNRRLTLAAFKLVQTQERIIDIAVEAGYGSQEAFSRAFKDLYLKTPGQFRRHGLPPVLRNFEDYREGLLEHLKKCPGLATPRKCARDTFFLIGAESHAPRSKMQELSSRLWKTYTSRYKDISQHLRPRNASRYPCYGVISAIDENDSADQLLSYMAACEVDPSATAPQDMTKRRIEAQNYLVFSHCAPMELLPITNRYIWGVWMPQHKVNPLQSPDFEYYTQQENLDPVCEIWIPTAESTNDQKKADVLC